MIEKNKVVKILFIILIIMLISPIIVYSGDVATDPEYYKPSHHIGIGASNKIEKIASAILTTLSNIGIVVSIISISIIGIKYMVGSVEEKAKYKENIMPYIVGIFLLFGISTVVKILQKIGEAI